MHFSMVHLNHIPTSRLQKLFLAVGSAGMSILDPSRGDMIATFGEVTASFVLPTIQKKMDLTDQGRQVLLERPEITTQTLNIDKLRHLPENSLGKEYSKFLDNLHTTPDARAPVQFVDDPDLAYVMLRYRQTHDLYHTVLGMPTNMLGEVTVKWFEGIQLGLPMCVLGGLFGAVRLYPKQRQKYVNSHLPWVLRNAKQSEFLMSVFWEKYWEMQLNDLRRILNIEEPPS